MIIGVDYHPSFQTIAFLMEETGECGEQELNHSDGHAGKQLSANLGTRSGESGSTATVVAPSSLGADAHAVDHRNTDAVSTRQSKSART